MKHAFLKFFLWICKTSLAYVLKYACKSPGMFGAVSDAYDYIDDLLSNNHE